MMLAANCTMSSECYSIFLDKHREPPNDVEQFKAVFLWLIKHTQLLDAIPLDLLLNTVSDSSLLEWILSRQDLFRFGESNYMTLISEGLIVYKAANTLLRRIPGTEIIKKMEMLRNANVPYSESLISEILDAMDVSNDYERMGGDLIAVIEFARKELKCAWDEKVGRAAIPYGKFPEIFVYLLEEKCPI